MDRGREIVSPSPNLASLNASESGRPPEGTAMRAASSRTHIANAGRLAAARRSARNANRVLIDRY